MNATDIREEIAYVRSVIVENDATLAELMIDREDGIDWDESGELLLASCIEAAGLLRDELGHLYALLSVALGDTGV